MPNRTGATNPELISLVGELKKRSNEQDAELWRRLATDLEKPTRERREVNLSRLNRHTKENELVVVPGKVLGAGALDHKLTVAAFQFSQGAKKKLEESGSTMMSLLELSKEKPNGRKIRVMG